MIMTIKGYNIKMNFHIKQIYYTVQNYNYYFKYLEIGIGMI